MSVGSGPGVSLLVEEWPSRRDDLIESFCRNVAFARTYPANTAKTLKKLQRPATYGLCLFG